MIIFHIITYTSAQAMDKKFLFNFIKEHKYAVLATIANNNKPEAAFVGIAVNSDLRIIFDTVSDSRKYKNLLENPRIAFVIGWESEQTIQYEGIARVLDKNELDDLLPVYFNTFPDGRYRLQNWPNIAYFSVKPVWIRYSDFNDPQRIEEINF